MNKAFFLQTGCCLLLLSAFCASSQGTPQRVRTSVAPILTPSHTSDMGYIEVTGRSVWVPVANIGRNLQIGQLKPMLQRNQDFFIGLYLYDDGYAEMFAVPRILPDGSGSAWVTQEHEIMFGRKTETKAGRFFFTPTEFLPIIDETEGEYVVTCERHNRSFPLRLSKQIAGIRRVETLPDIVSRAMEDKQRQSLLAANRKVREPDLQARIESAESESDPRGSHRLEDHHFVNPYPEPVLEVRRNQSMDQEDPFMPMAIAAAALPRPALDTAGPSLPRLQDPPAREEGLDHREETAALPAPPPRVVRRHVIDNLSSDLRVEFQAGTPEDAEAETADAAPRPAREAKPALELMAGPSIEFQAASAAPAEVETPSPTPPEPAQVATAEEAVEPDAEVELVRTPAPFDDAPAVSRKAAPPSQLAAAGEASDPGPEAPVEPAPPSPGNELVATSLPPETPEEGQAPGEPTEMLAQADEVQTVTEPAASFVSMAANLLIFFALLTAGFVVVVIALALFLNRRKTKAANAAMPPSIPQPLGPPAQKQRTRSAAAEHPAEPDTASVERDAPEESQINTFSETLDDEFEQPAEEEDSGTFTGSLESFSVAELIQFLNSSRETGMLSIDPDDDDITCKIYFERGEIIDALSSRHTGEKAVADILSMRDGLFSFTRQQEVETHRTVRQSTMSLLLQVQPFDESPPLSIP